jgi:hypothetical protein
MMEEWFANRPILATGKRPSSQRAPSKMQPIRTNLKRGDRLDEPPL